MNTNCARDLLDVLIDDNPELIDQLIINILNTYATIDEVGNKVGLTSHVHKFHAALRIFMFTIRQFHITHKNDPTTAGVINQEMQKIISAVVSNSELFDNSIIDLYVDLLDRDKTFKENLN